MILLRMSPTFDMAPGDQPGLTYIGPQLDDPAWAEPWQSPWPEGDQRPLVLVGFSTTFQDHAAVLQAVIDALASLPVRALVTLGPSIAPNELRATENVRVVRSAPHNQVMEVASLVVTHGGYGTLARALAHKLPILALPQGRRPVRQCRAARRPRRGACPAPGADAARSPAQSSSCFPALPMPMPPLGWARRSAAKCARAGWSKCSRSWPRWVLGTSLLRDGLIRPLQLHHLAQRVAIDFPAPARRGSDSARRR